MTQLIRRRTDQPIIFNTRAVREEIKEAYPELEFWTCTLEQSPSYSGLVPGIRRGNVFISYGDWSAPQLELLNFRKLAEKEDTCLAQIPVASLTVVLGSTGDSKEPAQYKKLCEITAGEINPETYKALQAFMFDLQLNASGDLIWFNEREDPRWQALLK